MKTTLQTSLEPLATNISRLFGDDNLRKQNDFLHAQLRALTDIYPNAKRQLTDTHRRQFVKFALPIKEMLDQVSVLVKPETILRWNRNMKKKKWDYANKGNRPGRPRTKEDAESLVVRLAEENVWGFRRIVGELLKLGHKLSHQTVGNILMRNGLPTSPNRKGMSWKQFIESHMATAWGCDFFTEEVWTRAGLMTYYVLFFIHLGTRRVYVPNVTTNPDAAWTKQQARNFLMHLDDIPQGCTHLIHDNDSSFIPLDAIIKSEDVDVVKTPAQSPWCNGYAERFVREARKTLDNLILVGERQLRRTMKKVEKHHNEERPHQGIGNVIPLEFDYPDEPVPVDEVVCNEGMGGLLNHYQRKAA